MIWDMLLKTVVRKHNRRARIPAIQYRIPLPVREVLVLLSGDSYPICPRCDCMVDREYMNYCDSCGQCLGWELFGSARVIHAPRTKKK